MEERAGERRRDQATTAVGVVPMTPDRLTGTVIGRLEL
jgi:hypothetical protein